MRNMSNCVLTQLDKGYPRRLSDEEVWSKDHLLAKQRRTIKMWENVRRVDNPQKR
jgi:hypothetical protein